MTSKSDRNDLTQGVIWKKLTVFFFPILLGLLFQQLYSTVDAIIVGRYIGASALAAVGGSATIIVNLIIGFFYGVMAGASVIAAQEFGANDEKGLSTTLHTALCLVLIIGSIVTLLGCIFAPQMLKLTNNPEDIMADSVTYLRIFFTGSIPMLGFNLSQGVLHAVGDSRRPLLFLAISCVTNIILDYVFVAQLDFGIAGAAWASVIAIFLSAALGLGCFVRTQDIYKIRLSMLRINRQAMKRILKIGIPGGIQSSMYSLSNLVIQAALNGFGTAVVAAWAATGKFDGFFWVTSNAIGAAICAFVGQCYGAGLVDRIKKAIRFTAIASGVIAALFSAVLMIFARPAYGIFLEDEQVIQYAIDIMGYFVPYYVLWEVIEVLSGVLRGVGNTFWPMVFTMLGCCLVRVIWVYTVLPVHHTVAMLGYLYPVTWSITGAAFVIYYMHGNRLVKADAQS